MFGNGAGLRKQIVFNCVFKVWTTPAYFLCFQLFSKLLQPAYFYASNWFQSLKSPRVFLMLPTVFKVWSHPAYFWCFQLFSKLLQPAYFCASNCFQSLKSPRVFLFQLFSKWESPRVLWANKSKVQYSCVGQSINQTFCCLQKKNFWPTFKALLSDPSNSQEFLWTQSATFDGSIFSILFFVSQMTSFHSLMTSMDILQFCPKLT